MPLESGTYISDLVTTNPTSADPKSQGDDHLRLLKTVLKNTLAGFSGLVIATGTEAQGSTVNEFVVTVSPSPSAYTTAFILLFIASHSNSGAATIKINSLSSIPILAVDGSALESTDIESGAVVAAFYNGGNFYLVSGNDRVARNGDTYTGGHDATSATFQVATQSAKDGSTKSANTKYVDDADALKADLNSPALTGNPTAPTQAITDNSNKLATTAFAVQLAFRAALPAMSSPGFLYTDGTIAKWNLVTNNTVLTGLTEAESLIVVGVAEAGSLIVGGVAFGNLAYRQFQKYDYTQPWIGKTGAFAIAVTSDAWVEVNGIWTFVASGTAATMPGSPVAGTDYALWVKTGGVLEVTSSFTSPPVAGSRLVGGFHYAPGGNATGTSGGDSTPAINQYSLWDLKWRPSGDDPRGMHLVGGGFWGDIYITGVDHIINGTSKYNVTIADGSSPPRIPVAFGGNGSTVYGSYNWWEAAEVLHSHGKRLPTYMEYCALAYGVTEATSRGSDPGTTGLDAARTSKWGTMQATGNMYIWGADLGGPYAAAGYVATPGTRGSTYYLPNAVIFGGDWGEGAISGSRYSYWGGAPSNSADSVGSRGVSDHMKLV